MLFQQFDIANVVHAWPIILLGLVWAVLGSLAPSEPWSRPLLLVRATWISLNAGFWEELVYRWWIFFTAMITLPAFNWLLGGMFGWEGLLHWAYTAIGIPVVNFLTFGALAPQLLSTNWVLGAALVLAANRFGEAHEYQGPIGQLNAWYLGLWFFWITFSYGIWVAMVVHFLYDLIIFGARALRGRI